ncbi:hypothetical protein [Paenibacillus sp. UASWS1643]|uniref:hypothetical protein n=1 Tax=Paenibacillus sp. UASWS1643 TaxID=2580422 RepID=UPI00123AE716|nr:hypothetical protein [Paenibacillus sp. UASWS1643]KAA8753970.1 hypothetical protein FE296_12150 [Paenibacillus sp. UASWS1643]
MTQKNETNEKVSILTEMNFRPSASRHSGRKVIPNSVLTVVKHKSSTRLTFSPEVIQKIGATENVQVALNPEGIAIGLGFTCDENYFPLKKFGKKFNIYSSQLVNEIIDAFSLDFSNVSSISFQRVRYLNIGSHKVAFFKIIQNKLKPSHDMTNPASKLASNIHTTNDNNKEGDFETDPNLISLVNTYGDPSDEDELIDNDLDPRDIEELTDVEFELNDEDEWIVADHDQNNDGGMINRVPKSSPFKHKRRRKVVNE